MRKKRHPLAGVRDRGGGGQELREASRSGNKGRASDFPMLRARSIRAFSLRACMREGAGRGGAALRRGRGTERENEEREE
jgi:hypothetical protein